MLKVVENLPGVARAAAGSSSLVVWGSAPQDTRVYVDGVHVPLLYHGGGYRSILPSNFVKSVELAPGGYGPSYGRGLGGLVTVAHAAPRRGGRSRQRRRRRDRRVGRRARQAVGPSARRGRRAKELPRRRPRGRHLRGRRRHRAHPALLGRAGSGSSTTLPRTRPSSSGRSLRAIASRTRSSTRTPRSRPRQTTGTDFQRVYVRYEKHLADGSVVSVGAMVRARLDEPRELLRLGGNGREQRLRRCSAFAPTGTVLSSSTCAAM